MKEIKTPYQILSTKKEKDKIKKLLHDKKPWGITNAEFLIKILEEVKK